MIRTKSRRPVVLMSRTRKVTQTALSSASRNGLATEDRPVTSTTIHPPTAVNGQKTSFSSAGANARNNEPQDQQGIPVAHLGELLADLRLLSVYDR